PPTQPGVTENNRNFPAAVLRPSAAAAASLGDPHEPRATERTRADVSQEFRKAGHPGLRGLDCGRFRVRDDGPAAGCRAEPRQRGVFEIDARGPEGDVSQRPEYEVS